MTIRTAAVIYFTVFMAGFSSAQITPDVSVHGTGPYFGRTPPGPIPVEFPFDFMPEGYSLHSAPAFMPGGEEVYFSAMDFSVRFSEKIFVMRSSDSGWMPPAVASFSGDFFDGSPSISSDGRFLFFSSARTPDQKGRNETGQRTIWFVERNGKKWGTPRPMGIDLPGWENGTSMSEEGNLYFDSGDIYRIPFPPGGAEEVRLGAGVNSAATELHPCAAPDERFLVFYSSRPGGFGSSRGDLYISFQRENGEWGQAVNLGKLYNQGHLTTSFPRLTPDGKYFFFLKLVSIPWQVDVFWVSVDALDDLRTSGSSQ